MEALIKDTMSGMILFIARDNNKVIEMTILPKWDMSQIQVPEVRSRRSNFTLSIRNLFLLKKALLSKEGQELLNSVKNEKTERVVNEFTKGFLSSMPTDPIKESKGHKQSLKSFLEEVIKQPLRGQNKLANQTIGLTQKEIWDRFVSDGLIKPIN